MRSCRRLRYPISTKIRLLVDAAVRCALIVLLSSLAEAVTYAQAPNPATSTAPVSPSADIRQHIKNLSALDYPVRMQAARLIRRAPEREAVTALVEAARRDSDEF